MCGPRSHSPRGWKNKLARTARTLILSAKRLPCGQFPRWRFKGKWRNLENHWLIVVPRRGDAQAKVRVPAYSQRTAATERTAARFSLKAATAHPVAAAEIHWS